MSAENYRLNLLVEMDTDNIHQAERWSEEIQNAIYNTVPAIDMLADLTLVDEFGEEVRDGQGANS